MAMDTSRSFQLPFAFLLLLWLCLQYFALGLNSGYEGPNMTIRCKEREREALLTFKQHLTVDYGRLSSWGRKEDQKECCKWSGISCSSRTGHVIQIDLLGPLDTSADRLRGMIPKSLGNLRSLQSLDLSQNRLEGVIPKSLGNLRNLQNLDLSDNQLEGVIPKSLGNLRNLQRLDLSYNNRLDGEIPKSFKNLQNLQSLNLSFINFSGNFPNLTGWSSLTHLRLANNQFNGTLPKTIGQLSQLKSLDLSNNQFNGTLPETIGQLSQLKSLDLSNNQFNATLPETIGQLSQLQSLYLSFNSFKGPLTERHLSNLTKLLYLDLSFNPLSFQMSSHWLPPFQLDTIILRSCKLGSHFPKWLQTQRNISHLDLSYTGISEPIPTWFLDISTRMTYFNLSFNQISGTLPELSPIFANYSGIDLSSNQFEGPLPLFPSAPASLNLSKNKFSGTLSFICKIDYGGLTFLDVSMNQFSGELPDCWMTFQELVVLNFAHNNLSGNVPTSMGSLFQLEALSLHNNSFSGGLPSTLQNCERLIFLDLGVNKLSGEIPSWMGEKLSKLNILSLRSNKFSGIIPSHFCHLSNLQILDLSRNEISGVIPKCISNLTAMTHKEIEFDNIHDYVSSYLSWDNAHSWSGYVASYVDSMIVEWKGREFEYKKILAFLKIIDLSNNMLNGKIPESVTSLSELVALNLSRNKFDGAIPQNIGQLKSLECLDLSSNKFSGEIPSSVSELSFLSKLDLSHNDLSGKIPSSTQLQSFDNSSYEDNAGLCGPPLALKCPGDEVSPPPPTIDDSDKVQDDGDEFGKWFYIGMGVGFAIGFWGVCGALLLYRPWRHSYFRFLDFLKDLCQNRLMVCQITMEISEEPQLILDELSSVEIGKRRKVLARFLLIFFLFGHSERMRPRDEDFGLQCEWKIEVVRCRILQA